MFSMPVVYEKHQVSVCTSGKFRQHRAEYNNHVVFCFQAQIDQYVGLIRTQVNSVVGK